ncbi:MAG: prolipoprotein diacylglyceryl transferase [Clostridia bacterium]|nr:prolipoprotein diacylglyceryl transferase [Clostridia bacterium]
MFGREFSIRWYAVLIVVGMILAGLYGAWRSKQEGIKLDDLLDMALFAIVFGIIGARLYYVLMTLGNGEYKSFYDVIAIWNGGLAIYGGIIAGALTIVVICRIKKINIFKAFDMAAPAVMIGQMLGRWGNFFNGEAYGYEVLAGSPLYFLRMGLIPNVESSFKMHYFHPTFLYESLWNLIGFIIINIFYKRKKFNGQIFYMYISWYGFGRMLIEGLRTDSLYIGPFRVSQVVGFLCFIIGTTMLVLNLLKARRARLAGADYDAAYPQFKTSLSTKKDETTTEKKQDEPPVSAPNIEPTDKTDEENDPDMMDTEIVIPPTENETDKNN